MDINVVIQQLVSGQLTAGGIMLCGGIAGIIVCLLAILICFCTFPGKRRRLLKKLGEE